MARKILITGINGMLSSDLSKCSETSGLDVMGYTHTQLDITNPIQVSDIIQSIKPDVVVNTPGISVDECENEPENGQNLRNLNSKLLSNLSEHMRDLLTNLQ